MIAGTPLQSPNTNNNKRVWKVKSKPLAKPKLEDFLPSKSRANPKLGNECPELIDSSESEDEPPADPKLVLEDNSDSEDESQADPMLNIFKTLCNISQANPQLSKKVTFLEEAPSDPASAVTGGGSISQHADAVSGGAASNDGNCSTTATSNNNELDFKAYPRLDESCATACPKRRTFKQYYLSQTKPRSSNKSKDGSSGSTATSKEPAVKLNLAAEYMTGNTEGKAQGSGSTASVSSSSNTTACCATPFPSSALPACSSQDDSYDGLLRCAKTDNCTVHSYSAAPVSDGKPFLLSSTIRSLMGVFEPMNDPIRVQVAPPPEAAAGVSPGTGGDLCQLGDGELSINILGEDGTTHQQTVSLSQLQALKGEWERIWVTADSGAAVSMIPIGCATEYDIQPTFESEHGVGYTAANSGKVYEAGKRTSVVQLENNSIKCMHFKVGDVNKALGSVKDICMQGNKVVFDEEDSYILNKKTGEKIKLYERNGTYGYPLWVITKAVAAKLAQSKPQASSNQQSPVFPRPAQRL